MFRTIANPRRTTLAHLGDAEGTSHAEGYGGEARNVAEQPEHPVELPTQTANPKRTVLVDPAVS
jgi:hypothetical protein